MCRSNSLKRVLHVGLSNSFGGIESFILNTSSVLHSQGYCFDFVSYSHETPRKEEFLQLGGSIYCVPSKTDPLAYYRGLRAIMTNGYDLVHIHKNSAIDFIPFLCIPKKNKPKVVVHAHNTNSGSMKATSALNRIGRVPLLSTSDVRLACSSAAGKWLYGDEERIDAIVPNGIMLENYKFSARVRERMRSMLGVGDALVIGCVGRFRKEKNQLFLVGVMKELVSSGVRAQLIFLGDGDTMCSVRRAFEIERLEAQVVFAGNVPNVAEYMQAFDVLAMPSLFEGFPFVAVEGQAAGLPVIMSEAITDETNLTNLTSYLPISRGSESLWAQEILHQGNNSAREGYDHSKLELFDINYTAKLISEVYQDALD